MRVSYFALCAAALVGPVVASLSLGESRAPSSSLPHCPEGQISSINAHTKLKEYGQASMKEICYRNLYAHLALQKLRDARLSAAFKTKTTKEVLLTDSKGATVFLSQGVLRNEDDVEMAYEEFCYKQYRVDEHKSDVQALSGIQVGKRDLINALGLSSLDAFKGFSPAAGNGPAHDGAAPLFAKGSFLDSFATHSPTDDDAFFSGTGATAFGRDLLDKDSVDGGVYKPDEGKADKGGELPKDDHSSRPEVAYSAGHGQAETADGKSKRAWAWRRFVMRSEEKA
ncbi:hypothetical protein RHOSPDRAFT_24974 [Rhodotorula sp. JG-1b]|nr:hypothetical protein RHOSPDRAFT_24974 [Rhodotorula sp. JG-1b]